MARRAPSALHVLIGIDKSVGCSSHDVVSRVRRAVGERRVGHAGTLDPLASGVMVVGVGQATRLLGRLTLDEKSYIAEIQFGSETATDDAEGSVTRTVEPVSALLDTRVAERALDACIGSQMQVPPQYSAISVNGVRSYRRAREGEDVELPARPIEVRAAMLLGIEDRPSGPCWIVAFTVSKGTYIRALARDIARSLGAAAHLSGLRRTSSGSVTLGDCLDVNDLSADVARAHAIDPIRALAVPRLDAAPDTLDAVLCGKPLALSRISAPEGLEEDADAALVIAGELRALVHCSQGLAVMKTVFPQGIGGVRS